MSLGPIRSAAAKKKTLPLLALLLAIAPSLTAQVRLGILGGLHSANVLEKNNIPGWDSTTKRYQSGISGWQLGVILDIPLGHKGFYFQPALTYTTKGRRYARTNDSATMKATDTIYDRRTLNINYIDIPLYLTYKIPLTPGSKNKNSFFLSAGPALSFFYSGHTTDQYQRLSTTKYISETDPVSVGKGPDTYKTFDLALNARAGFELGNVFINAYFSQGLTSFYNATYSGTFRHQLFGASLGLWLATVSPPQPPKPKDTDMDGIPDDQDLCPLQPGKAQWHGCPVPDTDHDGIDDEHDSCKTVAGLARYNGCPIPDSDNDGINDEEDKCPHQPGPARYNGCPVPDRDGDGINDEEDKCPDTPGTRENQGCPPPPPQQEIRREIKEKIDYTAKNILFKLGSDQLTDSSCKALDDLAKLMIDNPEWKLTIQGHTDNVGTPERNLILSQKRAESVRTCLINHGAPAERIVAKGFGQQQPIADNATPAGKAANRRVELKVKI